jgi:hypothetical protein
MFEFDDPFAMTIFCDDVRNEIGGKFSYVGIYTGGMEVPTFPAALPKFAFVVSVIEPRKMAEVRDEPIQIKIYLPGETDPAINGSLAPIKEEVYRAPVPYIEEDPGANVIFTANAIFVVAPLVIQRPGRIRVRCEYPGVGLMRGGSLGVLQGPAAQANAPSASAQLFERSPPSSPETASPPAPSLPSRPTRRRRS